MTDVFLLYQMQTVFPFLTVYIVPPHFNWNNRCSQVWSSSLDALNFARHFHFMLNKRVRHKEVGSSTLSKYLQLSHTLTLLLILRK